MTTKSSMPAKWLAAQQDEMIARLRRALEFPDDVEFAAQDARRLSAALPAPEGPEWGWWFSSTAVSDD